MIARLERGWDSGIDRLAAARITRGCGRSDLVRFCPDAPVTRGQMARFLAQALQLPRASDPGFVDDRGHTFEDDIARIAAARITRGCTAAGDRFCPDAPVSRGQMAAFIANALEYQSRTAGGSATRGPGLGSNDLGAISWSRSAGATDGS